jgi:tetratricopeptide (TPR) repeat protein
MRGAVRLSGRHDARSVDDRPDDCVRRVCRLPGQAQQENWSRCQSDDPDRKTGGCSAVIQSGRETGFNPANAFRGRSAYAHKGDYDRAFRDCDQALQLNPSDAKAFYGRGTAHWHQGAFESQSEATPTFSLTSAHLCHPAKIVKFLPFVFWHLQTIHVTTNPASLIFSVPSESLGKNKGYLFITQFHHPI